ncbi:MULTISPECIES: hypothetical protein [Ferrimicrobium]|uniref:hypothetical protein n=1 Tax=Ferrimicrobium TaxID=121038 RepID=UPI0023F21C0E|nr:MULTISPECIES: hypothetical protein [Ferrimicrobium]
MDELIGTREECEAASKIREALLRRLADFPATQSWCACLRRASLIISNASASTSQLVEQHLLIEDFAQSIAFGHDPWSKRSVTDDNSISELEFWDQIQATALFQGVTDKDFEVY